MTISSDQLETWGRQGSIDASAQAYASIRAALDAHSWPAEADIEIYLQGSYGNDTNVRANSDVDVVVQLNSTFRSDVSSLSPLERNSYQATVTGATYGFDDFRSNVESALENYYGFFSAVSGTKSIKVNSAPPSGGLRVDVIPCLQYRSYYNFVGGVDAFIEGMTFSVDELFPKWIVNYPKRHMEYGTQKQKNTNGMFKRYVRIFKNARSSKNFSLFDSPAPSYFLECFLSQAPDNLFVADLQDGFVALVNWMYGAVHSDISSALLCQNRMIPLFGDRQEQWRIDNARTFVNNMVTLWKTT